MGYSRYKQFETVWNSSLVHNQKGFPKSNLTELFADPNNNDISYKIPLRWQYRPDLIANHFYKNPTLFFVLVYANNFRYCPEDFTTDTIIKVPRYERMISLL